jgi:hypothetical protein
MECTLHEGYGYTIYEQGVYLESWNRYAAIYVTTNNLTNLDIAPDYTVMKGTVVKIEGAGGYPIDRLALSVTDSDDVYSCP